VSVRTLLEGLGGLAASPALLDLLRVGAGRPRFPAWLRGEWFEARGVGRAMPRARLGRHALAEQLAFTVTTSSLPMLLRYEDRNAMAFSVENRVPFLVPALVEYVLALPEAYVIAPDGTSKSVFRAAMRGLVPDPVLDRRDKIGFATPERQWLDGSTPLVLDALTGETARAIPALDVVAARAEWEAIRAGRRPFGWHVWRWISVVRWTERHGVTYAT
jgi:asparagine synthase (glutamine-hydrolysing)